jgi:hypothetical protein
LLLSFLAFLTFIVDYFIVSLNSYVFTVTMLKINVYHCNLPRPSKPCVGGYTPKRPRFEPEEVAPETNRGSTYFPTGDNRRPAFISEEGATTTTSSGDSRHPKEVTTDEEDFSLQDIQVHNTVNAAKRTFL